MSKRLQGRVALVALLLGSLPFAAESAEPATQAQAGEPAARALRAPQPELATTARASLWTGGSPM
ncbi:MAG: hypothetical protein JO161_05250 [Planctomycetaceae bacterium]|nr:hypothetical protein [Planctomycetaceae bacterium]